MGITTTTGRQADSLRQMATRNNNSSPPKVLAVSSGKGGVGKTSIVANLACSLAKSGKKVLIFDADMGLNNIDILLGLKCKTHIGHVLSGEKTIEEVLVQGPRDIQVLPASNGWQELTTLDNQKKLVLLEELDRVSGEFDFLIFDTGAGISSNVTYFCSAAHEILLVTNTEPTSHTDVYALMKVLYQQHQQKKFRLIVNSVKDESEALGVFQLLSDVIDEFLTHVTLEYFGFIQYDQNVTRAIRHQRAFVEMYPYSKASQCIQSLSGKIIKERSVIQEDGDKPFLWRNVLPVS